LILLLSSMGYNNIWVAFDLSGRHFEY